MEYLYKSIFGTTIIVLITVLSYYYAGNKIKSFGYKTPMSLKNQQTFDYANRLAKKISIVVTTTFVVSEVILFTYYPEDKYFKAYDYSSNLLIISSLLIIPLVEIKLRLKFDNPGKIKH
jgi:ABC-type transporter Mla maintaining outer membrane lipid asymmetry permease subunit MlaE